MMYVQVQLNKYQMQQMYNHVSDDFLYFRNIEN